MNMGTIPDFLLRHTVNVEPFLGAGAYGPRYGETVELRCWLEEKRRLVRNKLGEEVVSEATFYTRLDSFVPVESKVTLPSGRVATVLAVSDLDGGGLAVPDHREVSLT